MLSVEDFLTAGMAPQIQSVFTEVASRAEDVEIATRRTVEFLSGDFDGTDDSAWIALAVIQCRAGWLSASTKETALSALDRLSGSTIPVAEISALLRSNVSPRKIFRRREQPYSPLLPGDVVGYTHPSGREVAFWVLKNKDQRIEEVDSLLQLAAIGDPLLPTFEALIVQDPPIVTNDHGRRLIPEIYLWLPQDIVLGGWRMLGHAPIPLGRERSYSVHRTGVVTPSPKGMSGIDDDIDRWVEGLERPSDSVDAVQRLIDASPSFPGKRVAWVIAPTTKATELAIHVAQEIRAGRSTAIEQLFVAIEDIVANSPKAAKVAVADGVVRSLFNLSSHPEVEIAKDHLALRMGPKSQELFFQLDEEWRRIHSTVHPLPTKMKVLLARSPEDAAWRQMASHYRVDEDCFIGINERARYGPSYFWTAMSD